MARKFWWLRKVACFFYKNMFLLAYTVKKIDCVSKKHSLVIFGFFFGKNSTWTTLQMQNVKIYKQIFFRKNDFEAQKQVCNQLKDKKMYTSKLY